MTTRKGEGQPDDVAASQGVVRAFNRNRSFAAEVLRENERLRYKNLDLQRELLGRRSEGTSSSALDISSENERLRRQLEEINEQFALLRSENEDYRQRFQEIERQNESLVNMYVSSFQLHGTLDEEVALGVVKEILLNLVGAEVFAIWLLDAAGTALELTELVDERGMLAAAPAIPGAVWQTVNSGAPWYAAGGEPDGRPLCCIPLKVDDSLVGAIGIYRLLVQKSGFSSLDQELLGLLAGQAGASLVGARAFSRSGMKLGSVPAAPPVGAVAAR